MRKAFFIPLLVGILALGAAQAFAQSATVVLRNGDRLQAEVRDMGQNFMLRVNGQPRQVPIGDVVLIDFGGNGRDIPIEELRRAHAASGYVVMRNGETFNASLRDLMGDPLIAAFSNGRKVNLSEVSRVYFGGVSSVAGFPNLSEGQPTSTPSPGTATSGALAPGNARSVVVASNVPWTNSGFNVRRGQRLRFEGSGEVRLSLNGNEVAGPAGTSSNRTTDKAPVPASPVGTLIGRIGNGQPFVIGAATDVVDIPDDGRLFLGVNDDHHADNSGNFVVRVWQP
jgi:hypothetical protein